MKQILIIEDDPGIQKWLTECLGRVPYDVLVAGDGKTGYELASGKVSVWSFWTTSFPE